MYRGISEELLDFTVLQHSMLLKTLKELNKDGFVELLEGKNLGNEFRRKYYVTSTSKYYSFL